MYSRTAKLNWIKERTINSIGSWNQWYEADRTKRHQLRLDIRWKTFISLKYSFGKRWINKNVVGYSLRWNKKWRWTVRHAF